jgi:hypothetical protein
LGGGGWRGGWVPQTVDCTCVHTHCAVEHHAALFRPVCGDGGKIESANAVFEFENALQLLQ